MMYLNWKGKHFSPRSTCMPFSCFLTSVWFLYWQYCNKCWFSILETWKLVHCAQFTCTWEVNNNIFILLIWKNWDPKLIKRWLVPNKLKCNVWKTKTIKFSTNLECTNIESVKLLDIDIHQSLKWQDYVEVLYL